MILLNKENFDKKNPYVFALDGGGSSSKCIAGNLNKKIQLQSDSTNILVSELSIVKKNIQDMLEKSEKFLNITRNDFRSMCIGITGLGRKKEIEIFSKILKNIGIKIPIILCSDVEIALFGAVGTHGATLTVGTGSIAYAIDENNTTYRLGGYGHILGDRGSGFWIACTFVQEAIRCYEYHDDKANLNIVLTHFRIKTAQELVSKIYSNFDKTVLSSLAKLVIELSQKNNTLAQSIIDEAVEEWVLLAKQIVKISNQKTISYTGSLLEKNSYLLKLFKNKSSVEIVKPKLNALEGAFQTALNYTSD